MVQTSNVPRLVGTRFGAVAAKMWCAVLQRQAGCLQAVSFESLEMFYFGKQTYGGFLKWDYSEIIHFHEVFHYKASILSPPIYGTPRAELLGTRKMGSFAISVLGWVFQAQLGSRFHKRTLTLAGFRRHGLARRQNTENCEWERWYNFTHFWALLRPTKREHGSPDRWPWSRYEYVKSVVSSQYVLDGVHSWWYIPIPDPH